MKKYKAFPVLRDYPIEFTCNKCGKTLYAERDGLEEFMTDTIHPFETSFGYGSLRDGESWTFDLCEECLEELSQGFVIPVKIERWLK